jgi:hypothetical protein
MASIMPSRIFNICQFTRIICVQGLIKAVTLNANDELTAILLFA